MAHTLSVAERIRAKITIDAAGCWLWQGRLSPPGYAMFKVGRLNTRVHVASYVLACGPVPAGLELDHLCRVRSCVNPAHLEAVTHRENVRRGMAGKYLSARTHCKKGHEFTPENTGIRPTGARDCKQCTREARAAHAARNVERERARCRAYYHRKKAERVR